MLAFALFLLVNEKKFLKQQLDEIFGMSFGGRYCILLMSLFSIFTGLIYNEFFSMPMVIFGPTHAKVGNECSLAGKISCVRPCVLL
jgi:V-type H+-transporting ATPase subunit a